MKEPPRDPPSRVRLRYCVSNAPPVVQRALDAMGAEGHDCFGRCRRCYIKPYIVTGVRPPGEITEDDVVEAESFEDLVRAAAALAGRQS